MIKPCKAIFRIAAARNQRAIARRDFGPIDAIADGNDSSGYFKSGQVACTWRRRVETFSLDNIGSVDARISDLQQNLTRPRNRNRALAGHKDFRAAGR